MTVPRIVAIVGPTAVGKSAVAEGVAVALGGEVVSADSMQVYRGMDIGTAKTPEAQRRVAHHCLDLVTPGDAYSVACYQRDARRAIESLLARDRLAVLAGGTGLYVRAALDEGMAFPPGDLSTPVRDELERRAEQIGSQALHAELARLDPRSAALIHPNNTRRVVRALEMLEAGVSYAEAATPPAERTYHYPGTMAIGLTMDRSELYARIDRRVDAMLDAGLLDEVRALLDQGLRDALTATQAIGYKEFVPVIEDGAPVEEAVAAVKQATRRYAKRQLTWFRADPRIVWLDVTGMDAPAVLLAALDLLESSAHT